MRTGSTSRTNSLETAGGRDLGFGRADPSDTTTAASNPPSGVQGQDNSRSRQISGCDRHRACPYRGGGPSINDLVAGQVQMTFEGTSVLLSLRLPSGGRTLGGFSSPFLGGVARPKKIGYFERKLCAQSPAPHPE